ncbi:hypothetical protein [Pseudobdellovibrio exovorus]|uniref:Uncharacterized protein n=1 Tax=Pseudobdellovibrio exovorus JSS TaxID=1184267 RepID=M4V9A2_9BACT|nr:hypothetical protein [Pseudobdellovibrio exovorus]AGH94601.1 hypothetical protein A11Q_381 [Pseudobdellovibrio exovorus JSS]
MNSARLQNLTSYLKAALTRLFTTKVSNEFYYRHEQLRYEQALENSKIGYINSFDKAA